MAEILLQVGDTQIISGILTSPITFSTIFGLLVLLVYSIIKWLANRYEKVEAEKGELAKEVIKLMVNVENKMDGDKTDNAEIKHRLDKIIDLVQKWDK